MKTRSLIIMLAVCLALGMAVFMAANSAVAADNGMDKDTVILAKRNGPGNGTGTGTRPQDGTGNGPKSGGCTRLTSDAPDNGNLIAGRGRGTGTGTGTGSRPQNGTGPRGGTSSCPIPS